MSKRQVQKMLRLMASGEPVELTSPLASVKKLARLAFIAQQFGYEYVDVRQSAGRNNALVMLIAPDPSPQARARAGQNWAQYPNAGDGVSVPPLIPDAFELLKARINFDLTGKSAEKRMGYAAIGLTIGAVILGLRLGADGAAWVAAFLTWAFFMAIVGIGFAVTRKRNVKFAARLQAAGFMPITDQAGRVRYLPPGAQIPGQHNSFASGPYGNQPPAPTAVPRTSRGTASRSPSRRSPRTVSSHRRSRTASPSPTPSRTPSGSPRSAEAPMPTSPVQGTANKPLIRPSRWVRAKFLSGHSVPQCGNEPSLPSGSATHSATEPEVPWRRHDSQ